MAAAAVLLRLDADTLAQVERDIAGFPGTQAGDACRQYILSFVEAHKAGTLAPEPCNGIAFGMAIVVCMMNVPGCHILVRYDEHGFVERQRLAYAYHELANLHSRSGEFRISGVGNEEAQFSLAPKHKHTDGKFTSKCTVYDHAVMLGASMDRAGTAEHEPATFALLPVWEAHVAAIIRSGCKK